jgi:hypothetical protein
MLRYILALVLVGCGSSVSVGDNNGDNRDNVTNIFEPENSERDTNPSPRDGTNPNCSASPFGVDGANGFLWKPVSDTRGTLVVLFPSEYDVQFESVSAVRLDGTIEQGVFSGFANGGRQHWRFSDSGDAYTGELQIHDEAQECNAFVSNPSERQD